MARAALPGRLSWQLGRVLELVGETARVKSIMIELPDWQGHRAGQHVDVRLTAEDGYQAQRSYSIASGPEDDGLLLTVERLDDGEVSPYLTDELRAGDEFELRGPIGGYFVWDSGSPVRCCSSPAGRGSSRCERCCATGRPSGSTMRFRLLYSSRTWDEVIYRDELRRCAGR